MTAPLRQFLLNDQIALAARTIAHKWTQTCKGGSQPIGNEHHTPNCNALTRAIEQLALIVKYGCSQPPSPSREPPPPLWNEIVSDDQNT